MSEAGIGVGHYSAKDAANYAPTTTTTNHHPSRIIIKRYTLTHTRRLLEGG